MCFCIEARARGWLWIGPASTDGFVPRMQARQLEATFQKAPHIGASAEKKLDGNLIISWKFPERRYDDVWGLLQTNQIECLPLSPIIESFFSVFPPPDNLEPNFKPRYLDQVQVKEGQAILPFQSEGIKFGIAHRGRFLLGDEPGCGKTLQAVGIAHEFKEDWPVLVIVPSSLRSVWKLQIELWGKNIVEHNEVQIIYEGKVPISPKAKFVVTSYELVNLHSDKFVNHNFKFLICDEAHKIKNSQAQRTQTVTDLAKKAKRIILMTGTPIVNLATDVYQLLKILAGQKDNFPSQSAFEERYFLKRERAFGKLQCSDPCREHELHAILESTVMIRRLKRDVLSQMPEKFRSPIDLDLALVQELKEFRDITLKGEYDALKQSDLQRLFHATCSLKKEASATYVAEVLDCSFHEKYLVFAHHVEMLDTLVKVVSQVVAKQGGTIIRICGKTPQRERGELVNKFQTDPKCRVAILGITACAEGLTLTAASNIIFAELHWTPAIMNQCEGRAHRMGQKKNVHIHYLLTPGKDSVDHKAYRALTEKQRHCDRIIDGLDETREHDSFPLYMKKKPRVLDNLEMSKKHQLFPKRLCRPGGRAAPDVSVSEASTTNTTSASSSSTAPMAARSSHCPHQDGSGPSSKYKANNKGGPYTHEPRSRDKGTNGKGSPAHPTKGDHSTKGKGGTTCTGRPTWLPVPSRRRSIPSTAGSSSPSPSPVPSPSPSRSPTVSSSTSAAGRWAGPPTSSASSSAAARWAGPPTSSASSSAAARWAGPATSSASSSAAARWAGPATSSVSSSAAARWAGPATSSASSGAPRPAALRPTPSDEAAAAAVPRPVSKAPAVGTRSFKPNLLAGRRIIDVTPVPVAQPKSGASAASTASTTAALTKSGDASLNPANVVPPTKAGNVSLNPTNVVPPTKAGNVSLNPTNVVPLTKSGDASLNSTNVVPPTKAGNASLNRANVVPPTKSADASLNCTNVGPVTKSGDASLNPANVVPVTKAGDASLNPTNVVPLTKSGDASLNSTNVVLVTKSGDASLNPTNVVHPARSQDVFRSQTTGSSVAMSSKTFASNVCKSSVVPSNTPPLKRSLPVVIDNVNLISDDEWEMPPCSKPVSARGGKARAAPQDVSSTASERTAAQHHTSASHPDCAQRHLADSTAPPDHRSSPSDTHPPSRHPTSINDDIPIMGGLCGGPVYTLGNKRARLDDSAPKENGCLSVKKNRVVQRTLDCLPKELPQVGFNRGKQATRTVLRNNGPGTNLKNARGAFGLHVDAERLAEAERPESRGVR